MAGFDGTITGLVSERQQAEWNSALNGAMATFEALVSTADRLGANRGEPAVIALYRHWIAARQSGDPHLYAAWFNLGAELNYAGDTREAMFAYRMALSLRGDFAPAAINLGLLLERAGEPGAALSTWAAAVQSDEQRTSLLNHRARLLEKTGQLAMAEQGLRASLATVPLQPDVIQHWVHVRQKMCLWPAVTEVPGLAAEQVVAHCGPLAALALFDDVTLQTRINAGWIERKTEAVGPRLSPAHGYRHDRLRVGYMSSDFCRHAMSFLIAELFERHDRSHFEIFGYCLTVEDDSDIRRRVVAAFDHFRVIRPLSDEAAARTIRQDEIDILIDLNGLTQGSRLQILRWRPAPVQATYLGFVGPVPVPELDYLFCDDVVVPPATAPAYRPQPLTIAANYQANDRRREIGPETTRVVAGLPAQGFVFCCFSNHYKITEAMFAAWMEILRQVDGAWLWLVADNAWSCANLQACAGAFGIDPQRLIFAGRVGPADYMSRLRLADLFLDTFPYNAGTVASDAIRMGLPLVTLSGRSFASRMAGRFLTAIGAEAGIATDFATYISLAVGLATDADSHAAYRCLFTEERWAATLGDIGRLTRDLEATLARIALRT